MGDNVEKDDNFQRVCSLRFFFYEAQNRKGGLRVISPLGAGFNPTPPAIGKS
jgi:hypothetical protein